MNDEALCDQGNCFNAMSFQQYKTIYILYQCIREGGMQKKNKKSLHIRNDWMCFEKRRKKSQRVLWSTASKQMLLTLREEKATHINKSPMGRTPILRKLIRTNITHSVLYSRALAYFLPVPVPPSPYGEQGLAAVVVPLGLWEKVFIFFLKNKKIKKNSYLNFLF